MKLCCTKITSLQPKIWRQQRLSLGEITNNLSALEPGPLRVYRCATLNEDLLKLAVANRGSHIDVNKLIHRLLAINEAIYYLRTCKTA